MATAIQQTNYETRQEIPPRHKWDLSPIFPSLEEWEASRDEIKKSISKVEKFRGDVMTSATKLADTLTFLTDLEENLRKLSCYASLSSDEDTRISQYQGMKQEVSQIYSDFAAAASFVEPEILQADVASIR